jgi:hypothetical protein
MNFELSSAHRDVLERPSGEQSMKKALDEQLHRTHPQDCFHPQCDSSESWSET